MALKTEVLRKLRNKDINNEVHQCNRLIEEDGHCPGEWDCNECCIYPILVEKFDGDCYAEDAIEQAQIYLDKIKGNGICKSIW